MYRDLWRFPTSPFAEMERMRSVFDDLFRDADVADIRSTPRGTFPMLNIGANDDAVTVYAFAPGVDADAIEVNIEGNVLTLSGKREAPGGDDAQNPYRRERFFGEFRRSVTLPDGLDGDRASARMNNGLLVLTLPKRQEVQPRRIDITTA
ncbi:MAG: Hsp20/alpha crystallin family protein [Woeseiaceae bacterium]|nr:Hsp20/alpha crystallin family protein [Woeseiaceae bacterium]